MILRASGGGIEGSRRVVGGPFVEELRSVGIFG